MQLHVHSDESYCAEPKSRSRAARFSTCGLIIYTGPNNPHFVNGPIRVTTSIISAVVSSATESSYAALFLNAQDAEVDRTLRDLGHPQGPTTLTYDNQPVGSIAIRTAKIRKSKAIDMRFHWIQDRIEQGNFITDWQPGAYNLADYVSKAHPIHHFKLMRSFFITLPDALPVPSRASERVC